MAKKIEKPKEEPKFRKFEKGDKIKIGKYYQIGDKHAIKTDKVLRIETKLEVFEHDAVDSLSTDLKTKQREKENKTKVK